MAEEWPFEQESETLVFTQQSILSGQRPILFAKLDEGDHAWQFLTGKALAEEEPAMISLGELFQKDPTIKELAKLKPGTSAYRSSVDGTWAIFKL